MQSMGLSDMGDLEEEKSDKQVEGGKCPVKMLEWESCKERKK